ncbi:unnamed protein product [Clonostachys byssicola]|uniref:Uncharacterized protein n=1 Tax=Clonostachys byssicola TaxID=160290 RepID=A0A9N9U5Y4_9HYPO|nr:unnamed protein product [Clonostachys byssicola]
MPKKSLGKKNKGQEANAKRAASNVRFSNTHVDCVGCSGTGKNTLGKLILRVIDELTLEFEDPNPPAPPAKKQRPAPGSYEEAVQTLATWEEKARTAITEEELAISQRKYCVKKVSEWRKRRDERTPAADLESLLETAVQDYEDQVAKEKAEAETAKTD